MFRPKKEAEEADSTPEEVVEVSGAFLGTLRSELDEPEVLPKGFQKLLENAQALVDAYKEEKLDKRGLAERIAKQRAKDATGSEWTVGATTFDWYRRRPGTKLWMRVPGPSLTVGEPESGEWENKLDIPEDSSAAVQTSETNADAEFEKTAVFDSGDLVDAGSGTATKSTKPETADTETMGITEAEEETYSSGLHLFENSQEEDFGGLSNYMDLSLNTKEETTSYQDTFDAGLLALLGEDEVEASTKDKPKEEVEGPAPRYGAPVAGEIDERGPAPRQAWQEMESKNEEVSPEEASNMVEELEYYLQSEPKENAETSTGLTYEDLLAEYAPKDHGETGSSADENSAKDDAAKEQGADEKVKEKNKKDELPEDEGDAFDFFLKDLD